MKYRKLDNSGLEVSEIALGCEAFVENNDNAKVFLDRAEKAGINYFDLFSQDPNARDALDALGIAMEGSAEFKVPDTEREHYRVLAHHAGECLQCGLCETRCPFDVAIRNNMKRAEAIFGL